ncbi:DEAD/DEAH box helicase [Nocardia sp. No.11]|uniref:DEAD/DEAH box helicase n=1 Tax=Nocardia sp. No.11 TaxID=3128861 RepID=UPI00319D8F0A
MTPVHTTPTWLEPGWEKQPLGRITRSTDGSRRSAEARFGPDRDWLVWWTMYAELLGLAKYQGVSGRRTAATDHVLAQIGAAERFLHAELHEELQALPAVDLGRKLVDEVLLPAIGRAEREYADRPEASAPERMTILAWYYALTSRTAARAGSEAKKRLKSKQMDMSKTLTAARWENGLLNTSGFPPKSQAALRHLTELLDQQLLPLRRETSAADDLEALLPKTLANKLRRAEQQMISFRDDNSDEPAVQHGISETGRLELLQGLLPLLARRMLQKKSILLLGPTSSGKSYAGRIAASYCAHRNQKAIILMPIKALVTQAVQDWKDWQQGTGLEWNVVPGSRDYPDHDDALVRGDFDIAVMIPEKLAALLSRGMRLDNVGVVVADELQMLSEDTRGTRLEMLLTRLRRAHSRIPIIALAAQLDASSTERIAKWLEIDSDAVIRATVRPVPLEKIVRSMDKEERVLLTDDVTTELRPIADAGGMDATRKLRTINPYQSRVLTLCLDLLAERDNSGEFRNRGILCFVQARDHAERYAKIIQQAATSIKALGPVPPDLPYLGRFRTGIARSDAEDRYREFTRIPDSHERDQVIAALGTGIGFHTARLDPFLREEMEWGFREGNIRLLFATDTLKLGINLPADVVVVASITTPNNVGTSTIIDRNAVAQRLGRAGRLGITQYAGRVGVSRRGRGYLVIPNSPPKDGDYEFAAEDEEQLARHIEQTGGLDTVRRRALAALADREAVFAHYIKYKERGLTVTSRLDDETLAILLLEHSKRVFKSQPRTDLEAEVNTMYTLSLKAQEPGAADQISPGSVVDKLVQTRLLEGTRHGQVRITALGRAIGHSGLPLSDAPSIERMAQALTEGAGHLTLLFAATQTQHVVDSTTWIAVRSDLPLEAESEQKRGVIRLARWLMDGAPEAADVTLSPELSARLRLLVQNEDLIGDGAIARRLYDLLDLSRPEPSLSEINALLRATVLLLWMRGCPFPVIAESVKATVQHRPDKSSKSPSPSPPVHPSDVRALGENTSYVFDTVCDLVGVLPENNHFRMFERMSDAIAYGLPIELGPLSRLNLRATHRDRLVHLVPAVIAKRHADLTALVRGNIRNPRAVAPSKQKLDQWQNQLFELPEFTKIVKELRARQDKSIQFGRTMAGDIGERMLVQHYTCQAVVDNLTSGDVRTAQRYLKLVFEAMGLTVTLEHANRLLVRSSEPTAEPLVVLLAETEVTLTDARTWARAGMLVVACQGVSLDVVSAPLVDAVHQSVVVEPSVLVETMYRIIELESDTESPVFGEVDDFEAGGDPRLSEDELRALLEDGDGAVLTEESSYRFELGAVRQLTGEKILHILHSAPPLLSRTDASRLLDGVRMRVAEKSSEEPTRESGSM